MPAPLSCGELFVMLRLLLHAIWFGYLHFFIFGGGLIGL
jgi:bacteriorhodopsin